MPRNIKIRITEGKLNEQTRKQRNLEKGKKLTTAWRAWSAQLKGFENTVSVADMVEAYNQAAKSQNRATIVANTYESQPLKAGLTAWKNKVMKSPELWKLIIRQMLPMKGYETVETANMTAFIPVFKRASAAISNQKESFGGSVGLGGAIDMFDGTTKPIYTAAVNYIIDKAARAIAPKFEAWQKANFYIMAPELKPAAANTTAGNESGDESGIPEIPTDELVATALEQAAAIGQSNPQGAIDALTALLVNLQNDPEAQALIPNVEAALDSLESANPEIEASPEATESPVETLASNTNLTPQQAQATSQSSAAPQAQTTGQSSASGGGTGQTTASGADAAPATTGSIASAATDPASMSGTTNVSKRYRIRLAHQNIKNPKGWKQSIIQMQTVLRKAGYDLGSYGVDGDYGPATVKAVKAFQTDNKLAKVDGIVGENTWAAMSKKAAEKPAEKATNPVTPKANKVKNASTVEEMVNGLRDLGSSEAGFARLRGAYKNVRDSLISVIASSPDMRPKTRAQGGGGNLARENAQYGMGGARKIAATIFRYNPDTAEETGDSENDKTIMVADLQKLATKGLKVQYGRARIEYENKQMFPFIKQQLSAYIGGSEIAAANKTPQEEKPKDSPGNRDLNESKSYDLSFDKWSKLWK